MFKFLHFEELGQDRLDVELLFNLYDTLVHHTSFLTVPVSKCHLLQEVNLQLPMLAQQKPLKHLRLGHRLNLGIGIIYYSGLLQRLVSGWK